VFFQSSAWAKIEGDPDKVIEWFDKNAGIDVAPRKISLARLKDYAENAMENDKPFPPTELVELKPSKELRLRKAKGQKGAE
jgi:hypothetical protein